MGCPGAEKGCSLGEADPGGGVLRVRPRQRPRWGLLPARGMSGLRAMRAPPPARDGLPAPSRHRRRWATITLLLQRGADPSLCRTPMQALFFAVKAGDVDGVRLLLENRARTDIQFTPEVGRRRGPGRRGLGPTLRVARSVCASCLAVSLVSRLGLSYSEALAFEKAPSLPLAACSPSGPLSRVAYFLFFLGCKCRGAGKWDFRCQTQEDFTGTLWVHRLDSIFETSWRRAGTVGLIGRWATRACVPACHAGGRKHHESEQTGGDGLCVCGPLWAGLLS